MKKIIFPLVCMGLITFTSCDDYLDINDDPNAITEVSCDNVFPTPEMNLATTMGVQFNVLGGYSSEVYAQNAGGSNYLNYSQFTISATNSSSAWTQLYSRVLQQLQVVKGIAETDGETGTILAATVLRAYTFQVLVDAYGEIPYSEALDPNNTQPKYDDGKDVYSGIIAELETAKANAVASDKVCANFLFGKTTATKGTADKWIKFANALLLKLYMRQSGVVDAKAKVASLIEENNFPTEDIGYDLCWSNAAGSFSPMYTESKTIPSDIVVNYALSATVAASADSRLSYNFAEGDKGMIGNVSGTNLSSEISGTNSSYLAMPKYRYDMPIWLITVAETDFFLAEYYATLNVDMAKAKEFYEAAVVASCSTCGVDCSGSILAVYPFEDNNPLKNIGIQKWIHLGCTFNGFESWCELRRLNYPAFSGQTAEEILNADISTYHVVAQTYEVGTIYTPKDINAEIGAGKLLERFNYASSSISYNNNAPSTKAPTVPVFWAE